jgi:hypothetical protein
VNGQFRYLKNCTGMWMIQELRRAWSEGGSAPDFEALMRQAVAAQPFRSFIDPDYPAFQSPGRMPEKLAEFCRLTKQPAPETQGEFYRAAMEGIVMRYREVWGELERLTGRKRDVLHMIGGATKDALHCQMTADALDIAIACGPAEGAAMGNAVAQMVATGDLAGFEQGPRAPRPSDKEDLCSSTRKREKSPSSARAPSAPRLLSHWRRAASPTRSRSSISSPTSPRARRWIWRKAAPSSRRWTSTPATNGTTPTATSSPSPPAPSRSPANRASTCSSETPASSATSP